MDSALSPSSSKMVLNRISVYFLHLYSCSYRYLCCYLCNSRDRAKLQSGYQLRLVVDNLHDASIDFESIHRCNSQEFQAEKYRSFLCFSSWIYVKPEYLSKLNELTKSSQEIRKKSSLYSIVSNEQTFKMFSDFMVCTLKD